MNRRTSQELGNTRERNGFQMGQENQGGPHRTGTSELGPGGWLRFQGGFDLIIVMLPPTTSLNSSKNRNEGRGEGK